ncbi:hypothetical protein B0H13DRAFT_2075126 [Mycena leptocephala]|nr:hypothetical protein B0H13DRAFT_2075126 [Mycena leptocephala]
MVFGPMSLPTPSAIVPPRCGPSPPEGSVSSISEEDAGEEEEADEELDSGDQEILRLVTANMPSHRGRWKKDSAEWRTLVSHDRHSNEGDDEDDNEVAPQPPAHVDGSSQGKPFAKVDGVSPGSPAAEAGLQREDLVVKFGSLTQQSFSSSSLTPLMDIVAAYENRSIPLKVLRSEQMVFLSLTPRAWEGRGLLGCHIVPYSPP